MTWHSATVPADVLPSLLAKIRNHGGTVTGSRPQQDRVCVTWTTASAEADDADLPNDR